MSTRDDVELKIEYVPISKLIPSATNSNVHTHDQIDQIAESIRLFGNCDPIGVGTDEDGELTIIEGHGRYYALKNLGRTEAPVIFLDHLGPEEKRQYGILHNQLTRNSEFDMATLEKEFEAMPDFDWEGFGFDEFTFDMEGLDTGDGPKEAIEDDPPESAPERVKRGQVWQLGKHRLMCGDATDSQDVERLMGGARADVCFTSSPYNMNVNTSFESAPNVAMGAGKAYKDYNDDKTDAEYSQMLRDSIESALAHCDDAMFNIGVLAGSKHGITDMLHAYAGNLCDIVVWNKSQSMPHGMDSQRGMLSHRCELVFCFNQGGSRAFSHPQWEKGTGINRIDTVNASGNDYAKDHSATFPVEFAYEVVKNFTDESVLDLFGGTGTTLIAAEQLGRKCYMMELDPRYCDLIIERWERLTGGEAVPVG